MTKAKYFANNDSPMEMATQIGIGGHEKQYFKGKLYYSCTFKESN